MPYNLDSPNGLLEPFDASNPAKWFVRETMQIDSEPVRNVVRHVALHLKEFIHWPERAVLLWEGCDRKSPDGKKQKYHRYPQPLRDLARQKGIKLDTRPNGPAIAAFQIAGGTRPERFGSSNA